MRKFFSNISDAIGPTKEIYTAKKNGIDFEIKATKPYPLYRSSYWYSTMEGCLLSKDKVLDQAVKAVFDSFDEETRHSLTFSPAKGGWIDRARFWQKELKPVLPQKQYTSVMLLILDWYIQCTEREGWCRHENQYYIPAGRDT